MKTNESMRKVLSVLLCVLMLTQYVPTTAFAAAEDGLCEHHTAHTADCGYVEAVAGADCTHVHDAACGHVATVAGSGCTHVHDEACGYMAAVAAHECHYECAECAAALTADGTTAPSTEPAPVCDCGTDDESIHATTCAVYVAPETAVCCCAEKCSDTNIWCDVCGFDYTKCGGTDTAAVYADAPTLTVTRDGKALANGDNVYAGDVLTACCSDESITYRWEHSDTVLVTTAAYTVPDTGLGHRDWLYIYVYDADGAPVASMNFIYNATCTCDTRCTEESVNIGCEVCTADISDCIGEEVSAGTIPDTVYFNNSTVQWECVYAYYWSDSNSNMPPWPGDAMTDLGGGIWSYDIPADASYVIFNDNNNGGQTVNLTIPTDGKNCFKEPDSFWYVYPCTHSWMGDTCTLCGAVCDHSWTDGTCSTCRTECVHQDTDGDGTCDTCGITGLVVSRRDGAVGDTHYYTTLEAAFAANSTVGDYIGVYKDYTLNQSLTLWENTTLRLDMGGVLTFGEGVTITSSGTVVLPDTTAYADIPTAITGGTVTIGMPYVGTTVPTYTWDSEAGKWVCAEGTHSFGTNGSCTTCGAQAVAKVGDTYYATLAEAATKVTADSNTIEVLTDVTIGENESLAFAAFATLEVAEGKTITCDGTVTIGEEDGIIFENTLYYYGGDITQTGLQLNVSSVIAPAYYTAGDGYLLMLSEDVLELHNATITSSGHAICNNANSSKTDAYTIKFFGNNNITNLLFSTSEIQIPLTLEAGDQNAVLTVTATKDDGITCGALTVKSGTVNVTSADTIGISADGLTVETGAIVNASAVNSEVAVMIANSGSVTVDGTLNTSSAFAGILGDGSLTVGGNGTVNALVVKFDTENAKTVFSTVGNAVISADMAQFAMDGTTATFTVPTGSTLTVNEGVTLDLSGLTLDAIDFSGTIVNNGTIKLPSTYETIPTTITGGTVTIGEKSYSWNGEKWVCDESSHVEGNPATCTSKAVCTVCGESYGNLADHNWSDGVCTYGCDTTHDPHSWANGICTVCGYQCVHSTTEYTDNGDGTHSFACTTCGTTGTEAHTLDSTTGYCAKGCGANLAVAAVLLDDYTYYTTVDAAFAAAKTAGTGTVCVLVDCALNTATDMAGTTVGLMVGENVTLTLNQSLKLNGKIYGGGTVTGSAAPLELCADGSIIGCDFQVLYIISYGELTGGTYNCRVYNAGLIRGGVFKSEVENGTSLFNATISGGSFEKDVTNYRQVTGGEFAALVLNSGSITGGTYNATLHNYEGATVTNHDKSAYSLGDSFSITNEGTVDCTDHIWAGGTCRLCAKVCDHSGNTNTSTDLGNGTHSFTCSVCGDAVTEDHTLIYDVSGNTITASCSKCNEEFGAATITATGKTYDGTAAQVIVTKTGVWKNTDIPITLTKNGESFTSNPVNAGTYTASITLGEQTVSVDFTVAKADPVIGDVDCEMDLYDSTAVSNVELIWTDMTVDGTLVLTDSELTAGEGSYNWKFTPADTDNYNTITGTVVLNVTADVLEKIEASGTLEKSSYAYGDTFSNDGLKVTATYTSGATKNVTELVSFNETLAVGQTSVVLTYQGKTCTVDGITVAKKQIVISGIGWEVPENPTYRGTVYTAVLKGTLPEGVTVTKTGDTGIDAGDYTAKAVFSLADGYSADNYEIVNGEDLIVEWSIAKKDIAEAEVVLGDTLTYNGKEQTQAVTKVEIDGLTVTYTVSGNTGTDAKGYTLMITGNGNFTGTASKAWSIAKKDISDASITLGGSLTYNGSEQTMEVTDVKIGGLTVTYDVTDNKQTNADSYTLTVTGNGNFEGTATADWSIAKAKLTITAKDTTITYGDAPAAAGLTYSGFVSNEDEAVLGGTVAYSYSYEQYGNVGTYKITPAGLTSGNYEITFADGTLTVAAKAITVMAEDKSKTYGEADPTLTYTVEGLVNGDELTGELNRVAGENVGNYAIEQNTLTAGNNYAITYSGANLTIDKRNVTVSAKNQTITYGETISDTEITATGLVDGHSVTVTLTPSTANVTVSGTITADAAVITADGTDATANYNVSYTSGKLVIELDTSKIDALTTENVTSANEEDIKAVQAMMASAETDGADEATAEQWAAITTNCEALIERIEEVEVENKALTDQAATFDEDTVKSTDKTVLEQLVQDIEDLLDTQNLTEDERTALEAVLGQVEGMIDTINETAEDSKAATDAIDALDPATVTSDDKDELEQAIATIDELLKDDHLIEEERSALIDAKADAEALIDVIEAAQDATDTENTEKVEDVTAENVKPEDKDALEDAKADLEKALEDNAGNYTEEEKQAIQDEIQRIEDAIEALENVEDVTETITQLPETVEPDDEETAEKILDAKKAYDELTDHEKSLVDETTKEKLDGLVAALTAYKIIKGNGGKWTKGGSYGLSFTANGPFSKFVGIEVDGEEVASTYYTAEDGSTVITLKQSFLKRLSTSEHTITVLYTDGEASGTFKVLAQSTSPATGDDSNLMLWSGLLCVSTLGLVALLTDRKRRRSPK